MQRAFPDLTPVAHKTGQYQGWIDGVTRIESLFTGQTGMLWQYRIYLSDGSRRVAPEQDLVAVAVAPEFPPRELLSRYVESIEGQSDLHALGYNLSDMNPDQRRKFLDFCALPILGAERVLKNLCDILWRKLRGNKIEKIEKYHNAIGQWTHDLDFVLSHPRVELASLSRELLNYIAAVKTHIARHTEIPTGITAETIMDLVHRIGQSSRDSGETL